MEEGSYTCVNCQISYDQELAYKEHYKSEHHRYNVKRKLIALPPLSLHDYLQQFQPDLTSRSQSNSEIHCEVCSKKFMSSQTYKQHLNSQKHKNNRRALLYKPQDKSESSSLSQFELIDEKTIRAVKELCPFCVHPCTEQHLRKQHCFPPFPVECINLEGLLTEVRKKVQAGSCIYCENSFGSQDSAKQHMIDVGHAKLNLENFTPFEPFYLWKINQSSQEEQEKEGEIKEIKSEFNVLRGHTLQELEQKRLERVKYGPTGVIINGKEVGYRAYKQYYKQFLLRQVEPAKREQPRAIQNDWRELKAIKAKPEFQKITQFNNHR